MELLLESFRLSGGVSPYLEGTLAVDSRITSSVERIMESGEDICR